MAIAFLGDIEGRFDLLEAADAKLGPHVVAIIQVGDFGFYSQDMARIKALKLSRPVYVIDGNHEDHDLLDQDNGVVEIAHNLFFVPRGEVLNIDGKRIGFLGGAGSVDKKWRNKGGHEHRWSEGENIMEAELARFDDVGSVDMLVTHVPPQSVIERHFDPRNLENFDLPRTWVDSNAKKVERVWNKLGQPNLICGHMHKAVLDGPVRILGIAEAVIWITEIAGDMRV